MLDQKRVFETLKAHGVSYFAGVPDSYLNGFCNYALANCGDKGDEESHQEGPAQD